MWERRLAGAQHAAPLRSIYFNSEVQFGQRRDHLLETVDPMRVVTDPRLAHGHHQQQAESTPGAAHVLSSAHSNGEWRVPGGYRVVSPAGIIFFPWAPAPAGSGTFLL